VPGADLPRLGLEDAAGHRTAYLPLALGTRKGFNSVRSGFQEGSATDLAVAVSYVSTLDPEATRPGYPEDLQVTFGDAPLDTSKAAIGRPAVPVHFKVETRGGMRLDFRFYDLDGDGTLSADGEYIDILIPDPDPDAATERATWHVEVSRTAQTPPTSGDVYLLAVDNAGVDADLATWQAVRISMGDFGPSGVFDMGRVAALRFANGTSPTLDRIVWFDLVTAVDHGEAVDGPAAPSDVTAQAGDSSVVLRWDAVAGVSGYHVFRRSGAEAPFERLTGRPTRTPNFADLEARNGTSYDYVVRSVGADGVQGGDASPVTATPQAGLPDTFLDLVAETAFGFFWNEANPSNGLIKDRSTATSPASIASVGFGLSAITVGIDRGWITREEGVTRVLNTLRFFWNAPQSETDELATGYKGFFYHFLDMNTGERAWKCELSTIDTALLLGGILHARGYFTGDTPEEDEIRSLATSIYERVDWAWAQARPPLVSMGWKPGTGFLKADWKGYNEAMLLYVLALGSPTHPVEPAAWTKWTETYDWETHYGYSFVRFPPLFGHQYSHTWIDFRGIRDAYMQEKGIDYFENSRRATLAQRAYSADNPNGYPNYSADEWGLTASDIPNGYRARGAPPPQNDDGTIAPTAPGGSIAFTPEESAAALRRMYARYYARLWGPYGFRDAYNVSEDWFDTAYLGIDQGPILLMIENKRTGAVWDVFMEDSDIKRGLDRAGFEKVPTGIGQATDVPEARLIASSFPNPSRTQTQIDYVLPVGGRVSLKIYDVLGREVRAPVDSAQTSGRHAVAVDTQGLAAGLYVYVLRQGDDAFSGKFLIVH
ncbi:MAG TPA: glucoamylase family protein, partial [Rhodothermales bacterium]|nr:glucoamylase family protein [Rhodothermales bacterium]